MFSGTRCATLPAWQIASSHWEIVVVGCWCSSWGMMHLTHYTAGLLPRRKLMSPPYDDDTQCGVTYDVCTNSKHIGWDVVPSDCFMWVTHGAPGCSGGERTFFMQPIKEEKTMPLRCDFLSHWKSPHRVMWYTSVTLNLWEKLCSYVFSTLRLVTFSPLTVHWISFH